MRLAFAILEDAPEKGRPPALHDGKAAAQEGPEAELSNDESLRVQPTEARQRRCRRDLPAGRNCGGHARWTAGGPRVRTVPCRRAPAS